MTNQDRRLGALHDASDQVHVRLRTLKKWKKLSLFWKLEFPGQGFPRLITENTLITEEFQKPRMRD